MFLKIRPFLYSLVFLLGLEFIVIMRHFVLSALSVLFLLAVYQGKKTGGKWKFSVLPIFFTLSSVSLLYLIAPTYEQQIFIILASSMYYLSLFGAYRLNKYAGDQTAKGMNMAATVTTIFFTYAGFYGLYLNFLVPLWSLMLAYLLVTLFVSYQHFSIIYQGCKSEKGECLQNFVNSSAGNPEKSQKKVWIYSFVIALAMAELIWAMNFWPFGYLTTGASALILYYVLWDLIQSHFLNLLSKRRVVANMIFFSILITLILLSSKWIPVI